MAQDVALCNILLQFASVFVLKAIATLTDLGKVSDPIRNVNFLDRLILFLADNTESILAAKNISDFLRSQNVKISTNTVMNYLDFLIGSFFMNKVSRYDILGKRIFDREFGNLLKLKDNYRKIVVSMDDFVQGNEIFPSGFELCR